ncbi:hypothetical protein BDV26DRAFT_152688 [Aspergillus bertholletiae]|uniref:Hydrophobin n=1 Tax=Aspergillus bertholletiae TaxID=1226010 RepID=A0A5N7BDL5_9EURO|nr:hypothetical protein BDV26DRAFT_152688 [Aspergillus bertholletiae]
MKFTVAAILSFAITALAIPSTNEGSKAAGRLSYAEAKGECSTGQISCCNNVNVEEDKTLISLARDGLLNNLVGNKDSSCASASLIKEVNLLSFADTGKDEASSFCKQVTACCPNKGDCVAISGH